MNSNPPQFHAEQEAKSLNKESEEILNEIRNLKAQGVTEENLQNTKVIFEELEQQCKRDSDIIEEEREELKKKMDLLLKLKVLLGEIKLSNMLLQNNSDYINNIVNKQ